MAQDTRKRHMVDISDYAWKKLERLAARLDAAQYTYKGRPRYGKLLELAIEKLEDSTMEWTVEEVELESEIPELNYDNGVVQPTSETIGWWNAGGAKPIYAEHKGKITVDSAPWDKTLYGNAYISADTGAPIKAKDITFKVSAHDTASEELAKLSETLKDLNKGIGASAKSTEKLAASFKQAEQDAQGFFKPDPATIHEADVWTSSFTTKAGTFITLKARTDKEWTDDELTLVRNAINKAIAGSATFYSPFHVSFIGGTGFYEYAAVLDVHPQYAKWTEEEAKKALKAILVEKGLSGTKQLPSLKKMSQEYKSKNTPLADIHVTGVLVDGDTVKIASDLTQALSAPQQHTLTQVLELEASKYLGAGTGPIEVWMQNVPWNKLKLYAKYNTPPDDSWYTVVNDLASKVREWLLQGNFIGPLPQEKPKEDTSNYVSGSHKFEKAIDKNGTMQTYHTYSFVVHLSSFEAIAFNGYKSIISEYITTHLLKSHGYASSSIAGHARVLWGNDEFSGKIHITASVIKNQYTFGDGTVKNFIDEISGYLMKFVQMVQKPPF